MKKPLCVFAALLGLAYAEAKKYNLEDLLEERVCIKELDIDYRVCQFSDAMMLFVNTSQLYEIYQTKHLEAKRRGDKAEVSKLHPRVEKLVIEGAQHMSNACKIWAKMSYRGRRFIFDSTFYTTRAGATKPVWDSEEAMLSDCEWAERTLNK